jgi:hypothetical protein
MCIMRVLILAMRDHNRRFADYLFFDECCKQAMSQPIGIVGDIAMFHQLSEGGTSEDAPHTWCNHFQQMAVGVPEVKRLSAIFPSLP